MKEDTDHSQSQLLKYAEDIARMYENERTQREALESANSRLRIEIERCRRMEQQIRESEENYRSLFEQSSIAAFVARRDGILIQANDSYLKLLGYNSEEIIGTHILGVYEDPSVWSVLQRLLEENGWVRDFDVPFRRSDGKISDCKLSATVRRGPDHSVIGYHGIVRDITEQRRVKKGLEFARRMEALSRMAGEIAHEIRNPLSISSSAAQLLTNNTLPHDVRDQCAEKIVTGIRRASNILENLLIFTMPLQEYEKKDVELLNSISDALKAVTPKASSRSIQVMVEANQDRMFVQGSAELIYRAFLNLFLNALAAMPQFGTLTVTVDAREHEAIVAITDNGGGIPGDYLTEILDPFFSTFSHKGGVGLGLSVAYSIVRQHGGRMEVDSSHHTGTTFHVIRPMGKVSN